MNGSGETVATVIAAAATLLAEVADVSRGDWEQAAGARAQAQALVRRAQKLGEQNATAFAAAQQSLEHPDWRLANAVADAAEPPQKLVACAADVAELAEVVSHSAHAAARADAVVAAKLAAASAEAAFTLVEINLVVGHRVDVRESAQAQVARAQRAAQTCAETLV